MPLDRYVILPAMRAMGRRRRAAILARSRQAYYFWRIPLPVQAAIVCAYAPA
jgi:hypothetical protein